MHFPNNKEVVRIMIAGMLHSCPPINHPQSNKSSLVVALGFAPSKGFSFRTVLTSTMYKGYNMYHSITGMDHSMC